MNTKEINLKFSLPFKRNDGDEKRRLESLKRSRNFESVNFFSPYHSVVIVVDCEEIKLPVASIKTRELTEQEMKDLPSNVWDNAMNLEAPSAGRLPGRKDMVGKVEYQDKRISFLWKSMDTEKVYSCWIDIDLHIG